MAISFYTSSLPLEYKSSGNRFDSVLKNFDSINSLKFNSLKQLTSAFHHVDFGVLTDHEYVFVGPGNHRIESPIKFPLAIKDYKSRQSYLPIAYSSNNFRFVRPKHIAQFKKSFQLIVDKKVPREFLHLPLIVDENHETISIGAGGDLSSGPKTTTLEDLKEKLAEIILAVTDLHSKNLVHLDIKPENIFWFNLNNTLHYKLADLDTIIEVNDEGKAQNLPAIYYGTQAYKAPELLDYLSFATDKNLFLADSYSLGKTLDIFVDLFVMNVTGNDSAKLSQAIGEGGSAQIRELKKYSNKLQLSDVTLRQKPSSLLDCPVFGANAEERKKYFEEVRARATYNLAIDKKPFKLESTSPKAFPFLNKNIQKIYNELVTVDEEMRTCETQLQTQNLSEKTKPEFLNLTKRIQNLSLKIKAQLSHGLHNRHVNATLHQTDLQIKNEYKAILPVTLEKNPLPDLSKLLNPAPTTKVLVSVKQIQHLMEQTCNALEEERKRLIKKYDIDMQTIAPNDERIAVYTTIQKLIIEESENAITKLNKDKSENYSTFFGTFKESIKNIIHDKLILDEKVNAHRNKSSYVLMQLINGLSYASGVGIVWYALTQHSIFNTKTQSRKNAELVLDAVECTRNRVIDGP